ncbi:MAG: 4-phosphopantetheinyl transferase [Solirubrobacterales bacterium]|nr:4-phosphopantetheinyl transferase [Solirubrobacterales bacterium]
MGGPARALQAILPAGAVAAEIEDDGAAADPSAGLFPEERSAVEDASDSRRREFAGGRACARSALAMLGISPVALPVLEDGAPAWPAGVLGSITHKGNYRAAVVAPAAELAALGLDAELDDGLAAGVLDSVALPAELDLIETLLSRHPGPAWDRLLFSAKEAAVKAALALGRGRPELRATEIALDRAGTFQARVALTAGGRPPLPPLEGRWLAQRGMLIAVATIRRL